MEQKALTVKELGTLISNAIAIEPRLTNVWVVGETSDVRVSGGHCYLELIEKDDRGNVVGRVRATIWASVYAGISRQFAAVTGTPFASGQKVMVMVTANYHPAYGMSVNVLRLDPSYTMGDAMRRRLEIINRLQAEGIMDLNRKVQWARHAHRIAVISARGAAGYGDFINQLYNNQYRLRFTTRLFEATLQGERTVPTILDALERVRRESDLWDGVVIIRGGGATSDLGSFDSYELAAAIARFPLPVVVGIGHERDVTVLDYVANMRVKTPTAAAQWLIGRGAKLLEELSQIANAIYQRVSSRLAGDREQLAYYSATLPSLARARLTDSRMRLDRAATLMSTLSDIIITPRLERLSRMESDVRDAAQLTLERADVRLRALADLVHTLSPESTLARGYSLTSRADGGVVTSAAQLAPGDVVTTYFADGAAISTVSNINHKTISQ